VQAWAPLLPASNHRACTPATDTAVSPRLSEATVRDLEVQSRIPPAVQHFKGVGAAKLPPPPPPLTASENQVILPILPTLASTVEAALLAREQRLGPSPGKQRPEREGQAREEEGTHDQESAEENKEGEGAHEEEEEGEGAAEAKGAPVGGRGHEGEGQAHEADKSKDITGEPADPTAEEAEGGTEAGGSTEAGEGAEAGEA
jgi:hypothetical protein